jgi:hypothetical protein
VSEDILESEIVAYSIGSLFSLSILPEMVRGSCACVMCIDKKEIRRSNMVLI